MVTQIDQEFNQDNEQVSTMRQASTLLCQCRKRNSAALKMSGTPGPHTPETLQRSSIVLRNQKLYIKMRLLGVALRAWSESLRKEELFCGKVE